LKIKFALLPDGLEEGLGEVMGMLGLVCGEDGTEISAVRADKGLGVIFAQGRVRIEYSRKVEFFRALGLAKEALDAADGCADGIAPIREVPAYDSVGTFFDNSRNAVMRPETIKRWLRMLALMGQDTLYLYTEDTYEISERPYFGYMRGRFTREEIRGCDRYASLFGIELVPCIQTLAHLNAALRWGDFSSVTDCGDILLAGDEKTYALIDDMLGAVRGMYSTDRINIGMDEAEMVGLGRYLSLHGFENRFDIMLAHLSRVIGLCRKHGFRPMMWSDMFFKLVFGGYYGTGEVDKALLDKVPKDVALVYWNYYSLDKADYDRDIKNHLAFGSEVVFAGGAWKWSGFAPSNGFSMRAGREALRSCRDHGIKRIVLTTWGDDGAECPSYAVLPTVQMYAEDCYASDTSDARLERRLRTCCAADYRSFLALDAPDLLPGNETPTRGGINPSKYLLYQDILCGLYDRHSAVGAYNGYYARTADAQRKAALNNPEWRALFETSACLCSVLELKCDVGLRLRGAYLDNDAAALRKIADSELPELLVRVEKLHAAVRAQWLWENKPFGLEVLDIRFGALKERIRVAVQTVDEYLGERAKGTEASIPELEAERLSAAQGADGSHIAENDWKKIVSAGTV
jgi:hexosaminidase